MPLEDLDEKLQLWSSSPARRLEQLHDQCPEVAEFVEDVAGLLGGIEITSPRPEKYHGIDGNFLVLEGTANVLGIDASGIELFFSEYENQIVGGVAVTFPEGHRWAEVWDLEPRSLEISKLPHGSPLRTTVRGSLPIPGSEKRLEIELKAPGATEDLFFKGHFSETLSVKEIGDLARVDLRGILPKSVQKFGLTRFSFGLDRENKISAVGIGLGTKTRWKVAGLDLEMKGFDLDLSISDPLDRDRVFHGVVRIPLRVGVDLTLAGFFERDTNGTKYSLRVSIPEIQLSGVAKHLSKEESKLLPTFLKKMKIRDASLTVHPQEPSFAFASTLEFGGGTSLSLACSSATGNFEIKGDLKRTHLRKLLKRLGLGARLLPHDFDPELKGTAALEKDAGAYRFACQGTIGPYVGDFVIARDRVGSGRWGFALDFDAASAGSACSYHKIPGLSELAPLQDFLPQLDDVVLVASSLETPGLKRQPDVGKGVTLCGTLRFDSSNHLRMISTLLGLKEGLRLPVKGTVSAPNPSTKTELTAEITGGRIGDISFEGKLHAGVVKNKPSLGLRGTVTGVWIHEHQVDFDAQLAAHVNGGTLRGEMQRGEINDFLGIKGLTVAELGLAVGVSLEGVPSFGFCGQFVAEFHSSICVMFDSTDPRNIELGGSVSEVNLNQLLRSLGGSRDSPLGEVLAGVKLRGLPDKKFKVPVQGDDGKAVVKALDGCRFDRHAVQAFVAANVRLTGTEELDFVVVVHGRGRGRKWYVTDRKDTFKTHYQISKKGDNLEVVLEPQIYMKPAEGIFSVRGQLDVFGHKSTSEIKISPKQGFYVYHVMDPIWWFDGAISLTEAGDNKHGPLLEISTYSNPDARLGKDPQAPHFFLSGHFHLLGLVDDTSLITVTPRCLHAEIEHADMFGASWDLKADLGGKERIRAKGTARLANLIVSIPMPGNLLLKPAKFDCPVDLDVHVETEKGLEVLMVTAEWSFQFIALGRQTKAFKLNCKWKGDVRTFERLAKYVAAAIATIADSIYKEIQKIDGWIQDLTKWGFLAARAACFPGTLALDYHAQPTSPGNAFPPAVGVPSVPVPRAEETDGPGVYEQHMALLNRVRDDLVRLRDDGVDMAAWYLNLYDLVSVPLMNLYNHEDGDLRDRMRAYHGRETYHMLIDAIGHQDQPVSADLAINMISLVREAILAAKDAGDEYEVIPRKFIAVAQHLNKEDYAGRFPNGLTYPRFLDLLKSEAPPDA